MLVRINGSTWPRECLILDTEKMLSKHLNERRMQHAPGTLRKKDANGTLKMDEKFGSPGNRSRQSARCAGKSSLRTSRLGQGSGPAPASKRKAISVTKLLKEFVRSVASRLSTTNIGIRPVAVERVQTKCVPATRVLNLTLETENVFYANGVLVENCADALALTFASPVRAKTLRDVVRHYGVAEAYDPIKAFEAEWR